VTADVVPFPKPAKRVRLSPAKWRALRDLVVAQEGNRCAVCRGWFERMDGHHVYPRDLGGDDNFFNVAPLCGSGTTGCHGLVTEGDAWATSMLRQWVEGRRGTLTYLCWRLKTVEAATAFLDRYYPDRRETGGDDHAA
jgi:hypothetical protein